MVTEIYLFTHCRWQKPAIVDDCTCISPHRLFTSTQIVQDSNSNLTILHCNNSFTIEKTKFDADATKVLEQWIDAYHNQLPPLRNFILPVSVRDDVWKCQMDFYSKRINIIVVMYEQQKWGMNFTVVNTILQRKPCWSYEFCCISHFPLNLNVTQRLFGAKHSHAKLEWPLSH